MKSEISKLKNCFTALLTPFDPEDDLAKDIFLNFVRRQINAGVGLVPCGTTGESPTLSHEEHENVIKWCLHEAAKSPKKPFVLAGTGSNATSEALSLATHAQRMGVDGLLQVCPYYNKPTQRGLYKHFATIAEAVEIPIVIYNIPGRCGVNLAPETLSDLTHKYDNIKGYKAAEGNLDQIKKVIELCPSDFVVMSGDDNLTYDIMKAGGKGVISVASNVIPDRIQRFTEMMTNKEWDAAKKESDALMEFFKTCFIETNPGPIKYMAELLGIMSCEVRPPLVTPEPANRKKIKDIMVKMGLLTQAEADKKV